MTDALERGLIALGRHVAPFDWLYLIYALLGLAIGAALGLLTGLWGLAGLTLAAFSGVAILARRRYERSQGG